MVKFIIDLKKLTDNWFTFGIFLKIPYSEMKKIAAEHAGNIANCKTDLLNFWHRKNKGLSSIQLASSLVLSLRCINYNELADILQSKYMYGVSVKPRTSKS